MLHKRANYIYSGVQLTYMQTKAELRRAADKKYRESHKDSIAAYQKVYGRIYNKTYPERKAAEHASWLTRIKISAVIAHGGECARCGYDLCIAALDFHHVEPKSKGEYTVTKTEAEKCVLLCANCHREHHNGGMEY
jgi:5-methylcytosine-specific restriction endonuclease McrA